MSDLRTHDVSAGMNLQTEGASGRFARLRDAFHRVIDMDLSQRDAEIARLSAEEMPA